MAVICWLTHDPSVEGGDAMLVPELYCSDLARSLTFYKDILGFSLRYERPEERFAFLDFEGASLMLEQPCDPSRIWLSGSLEQPYGRGVNFQIEVQAVDPFYARVISAGLRPFWEMEERWYRCKNNVQGNRQFVLADPDGYLLRFFQNLGTKPVKPT
ncbi:MAG: VOC family protein [Alphaproteobacteria bacterium]